MSTQEADLAGDGDGLQWRPPRVAAHLEVGPVAVPGYVTQLAPELAQVLFLRALLDGFRVHHRVAAPALSGGDSHPDDERDARSPHRDGDPELRHQPIPPRRAMDSSPVIGIVPIT